MLAAFLFFSPLLQGQVPECDPSCCGHGVVAPCNPPHHPMPCIDCHPGDLGYSPIPSPPSLPSVSGVVMCRIRLEEEGPILGLFLGGAEGRAPPPAWQRARTVALLC